MKRHAASAGFGRNRMAVAFHSPLIGGGLSAPGNSWMEPEFAISINFV